jgi:hypothetical protein
MCVQVLQGGECIPHTCPLSGAARTPRRNGGHINPPLFHDYVQLKSDYGIESAKRIIRFRRAHLSALREAVEEIGALDHSQIRDVETLDVYFDHDTFKKEAQALEVWRKDMPEEAADSRVIEGSEAAKVTIYFSSPRTP